MVAPPELDGLRPAGLKHGNELVLAESAEFKRTIVEPREDVARLNGFIWTALPVNEPCTIL